MEAQEALNEEALDDGQAAQILADFNDIDIENQAPINHIDDYVSDLMMDKNKAFDDKLLNKEYTSRSDAYKMLALESTKKYKANIIGQFCNSRCAFQTHVVCVTDKNAVSLAECVCSYSAVIKRKRKKDDNNMYYIEKEGRNLEHDENCVRNSANCPGNTTVNPDAAVEVVEPNENGNQRESRHHVNLNARTCTCTNWHFNGIACCHALTAWDLYHKQQNDIPLNEYGRRMREWAVNSKPWFLAAKFIEAAEVLKMERIKLPADANIEEDDMMFPPICLARLNRGVPVAPQGQPRRRRINGVVRRCGNCNQPGHIRSKCRFNYVWFGWNDANDYPFQEVYRRSIRRVQ